MLFIPSTLISLLLINELKLNAVKILSFDATSSPFKSDTGFDSAYYLSFLLY